MRPMDAQCSDSRWYKVGVNLFQPIEHSLAASRLSDITHLRWLNYRFTSVRVRDTSRTGGEKWVRKQVMRNGAAKMQARGQSA